MISEPILYAPQIWKDNQNEQIGYLSDVAWVNVVRFWVGWDSECVSQRVHQSENRASGFQKTVPEMLGYAIAIPTYILPTLRHYSNTSH